MTTGSNDTAADPTTTGDTRKRRATKAVSGATLKVRAIAMGYYGERLRQIGDVFLLYPRQGTFSEPVLDKDGEPKTLKTGGPIEHPVTKEVEKTISAEEQFSPRWMEKVSADTPERAMSAQEKIDAEHQAIQATRQASAPSGDADVLSESK